MKIAFTSCMDATRVPRQPVWKQIRGKTPDVLLLLGDQIYMDWGFGRPKWLRYIKEDKKKALRAYAQDMHSRYQAQATSKDFVELLQQMAIDGRTVLLTWDDHDFAWNNALGAAAETDKHWVPAEVMAISHALFRQFAAFVKHPVGNYPAMLQAASGPPEHWPTPSRGVETAGLLDHQSIQLPYRILDTRWYRTARGQGDNSILGREQRADLMKEVKRPEGLLIVGAGSPLKHTYLFSEQDWVGKPGATNTNDKYDEFEELLATARRPVLYLSGDIHRVAWSGRINSSATSPSQVVQMLASPAAIANAGPKKFPPSFGVITITKKPDLSGAVTMALYTLNPDGTLATDPLEQAVNYNAGGWENQTLDGEAAADDPYLAAGKIVDEAPIAVLVGLARRDEEENATSLSAPLDDWEQIDDCYKEGPPPSQYPEPMLASATEALAGSVKKVAALTLTPLGNFQMKDGRQTFMKELIHDAFNRASAERRRSVVFYIHGLGKSPVGAIDQGYALRALYGCEPIVFCWPAGWSEGPIARYIDVSNAPSKGLEVVIALREALVTFGERAVAFPDLPTIIVARSAGANLLEAVLSGGGSNKELRGVSRIVLSSPAIERKDFTRPWGNAFADPQLTQVVVTVNENDEVLKLAKWFSKPGDALGLQDPMSAKRHAHVCYLNFTRSQAVGRLHDYLLLDINDQQKAVNLALLIRKEFQPHTMTGSLRAAAGADNVFEVL